MLVLLLSLIATTAAIICDPGTFYWISNGISRCQQCQPGCACPGNYTLCYGCSGGVFSARAGSSDCVPCPPGTTSDAIFNAGCDPENFLTPCANNFGPLGQTTCHPIPPPEEIAFVAPNGALFAPPQYEPGGPPFVPNKIPPYYDMDGIPMVQQSY